MSKVNILVPLNSKKLEKLPPNQQETLLQLKQALDEQLYTWKVDDFPMDLPQSSFVPRDETDLDQIEISTSDTSVVEISSYGTFAGGPSSSSRKRGGSRHTVITASNLFQEPDFYSELKTIAWDPAKNTLRKLDKKMLSEIRNTGEFSVPSQQFPGQFHVWRLSLLLQKGWKRIREDMRYKASRSLQQLIVFLPNLLYRGNYFSIPMGLKNIVVGLGYDLPSMFIGLPETVPKRAYLDDKINLEREKYILDDCAPTNVEISEDYKKITISDTWKCAATSDVYNLRELSHARAVIQQLESDFEMEFKKFEMKKRGELMERLRKEAAAASSDLSSVNNTNLHKDEFQRFADSMVAEKKRMIRERILGTAFVTGNGERVGNEFQQILLDHVEAYYVVADVQHNMTKKRAEHLALTSTTIDSKYPIRSLIKAWRSRQIAEEMQRYDEAHKYDAHNTIIEILRTKGLHQAAYFVARDKEFSEKIEPGLIQRLNKKVRPAYTSTWVFKIWNPKNWIITKNPEGGGFTCRKYTEYTVTSLKPFWRIKNFGFSIASKVNNYLYYLFVNMIHGPLGIRSLFQCNPFYPAKMMDYNTGKLVTDPSIIIQTLCSRIGNVWHSVSESRRRFEEIPDLGVIGKNMSRVFNQVWNYFFKGFLGTLIVMLFEPVLTLANVFISFFLIPTGVLWVPMVAVLISFARFLFWDKTSRWIKHFFPIFALLFGKIFLFGFGQVVGPIALMFGNILLAIGFILQGGLLAFVRIMYDFIMFYLVVKIKGRIPVKDSFLARRVQGPGLLRDFYFQIDTELAIVALQVLIEDSELKATEAAIIRRINSAQNESLEHIDRILKPLDLHLDRDNEALRRLQRDTSELLQKLSAKMVERRKLFPVDIGYIQRAHRVALPRKELERTLKSGASLVEKFYPARIFLHMTESEILSFWHNKQLVENDWLGLARSHFSEIFSANFLRPMEEAESAFQIKVKHASFHGYINNLAESGLLRDDLDDVTDVSPLYEEGKIEPTVPYVTVSSTLDASNDDIRKAVCVNSYAKRVAQNRINKERKQQKQRVGTKYGLKAFKF